MKCERRDTRKEFDRTMSFMYKHTIVHLIPTKSFLIVRKKDKYIYIHIYIYIYIYRCELRFCMDPEDFVHVTRSVKS